MRPAETRARGILCWGDVGWDRYADEERARPGGCALNVAFHLARAGAQPVACAGAVGSDGHPLLDLLAAAGVDVTAVALRPGPSPVQPVRLEGGER
ncbi:MAG: hypothetical protein D6731_18075, partial [Planctomycetota bacterium]